MLHKTEGLHLLVFVLSSEIVFFFFSLKHSTQVQSPCKFTVLKFLVRKVISHLFTAAKKWILWTKSKTMQAAGLEEKGALKCPVIPCCPSRTHDCQHAATKHLTVASITSKMDHIFLRQRFTVFTHIMSALSYPQNFKHSLRCSECESISLRFPNGHAGTVSAAIVPGISGD